MAEELRLIQLSSDSRFPFSTSYDRGSPNPKEKFELGSPDLQLGSNLPASRITIERNRERSLGFVKDDWVCTIYPQLDSTTLRVLRGTEAQLMKGQDHTKPQLLYLAENTAIQSLSGSIDSQSQHNTQVLDTLPYITISGNPVNVITFNNKGKPFFLTDILRHGKPINDRVSASITCNPAEIFPPKIARLLGSDQATVKVSASNGSMDHIKDVVTNIISGEITKKTGAEIRDLIDLTLSLESRTSTT